MAFIVSKYFDLGTISFAEGVIATSCKVSLLVTFIV
jgi:hypothetical protein